MSERPDPRSRPADPAGTRPKFDPDALRPSGDFRALPAGGRSDRDRRGGDDPHPAAGEPGASAQRAPERPGVPLGGHPGERSPEEPLGADRPESLPERSPESPPATALAGPPHAGPPSPHAPRFQFMLGAFGALAVIAVALTVSLGLAPKPRPGQPWSAWRPSGDVDPAVQIAEHVAPEYTSSPGHPLVNVTGGPPQLAGQPVVVALRSSGSEPVQLENNGVLYQLCGAGPDCSIPGKPSGARGLLVRREALELALYTFHYVSSTSQVIVTYPPLPPAKGSKNNSEEALTPSATHPRGRALLFRPTDLAAPLSQPLAATLDPQAPSVASVEQAPEARLVDQLTGNLLYNFELTVQQQTPVLLLQAPAGG